ncbi:hypothetical protein QR680_004728 [Steinernema hermaphroditum]|uniref:Uncharacterized protein n=1 Tax=Steinernema hermaphroditum TaxID=289476 RepID=A0AA39LU58_9BILA|nr:hypothetical protein QR680_004728 [Steinernema hermaphroditum]
MFSGRAVTCSPVPSTYILTRTAENVFIAGPVQRLSVTDVHGGVYHRRYDKRSKNEWQQKRSTQLTVTRIQSPKQS